MDQLPSEVLLMVLRLLDEKSRQNMRLTCRSLQDYCDSPPVWQNRFVVVNPNQMGNKKLWSLLQRRRIDSLNYNERSWYGTNLAKFHQLIHQLKSSLKRLRVPCSVVHKDSGDVMLELNQLEELHVTFLDSCVIPVDYEWLNRWQFLKRLVLCFEYKADLNEYPPYPPKELVNLESFEVYTENKYFDNGIVRAELYRQLSKLPNLKRVNFPCSIAIHESLFDKSQCACTGQIESLELKGTFFVMGNLNMVLQSRFSALRKLHLLIDARNSTGTFQLANELPTLEVFGIELEEDDMTYERNVPSRPLPTKLLNLPRLKQLSFCIKPNSGGYDRFNMSGLQISMKRNLQQLWLNGSSVQPTDVAAILKCESLRVLFIKVQSPKTISRLLPLKELEDLKTVIISCGNEETATAANGRLQKQLQPIMVSTLSPMTFSRWITIPTNELAYCLKFVLQMDDRALANRLKSALSSFLRVD